MNRALIALVLLVGSAARAEKVETLKADLDGDGAQEAVRLQLQDDGEYLLTVGEIAAKGLFEGFEDPVKVALEAVDIDRQDRLTQLRISYVSGIDSSMSNQDHYYWFTGRKLERILAVKTQTESVKLLGNGIIHLRTPRRFWDEVSKLVFDPRRLDFRKVEQPFCYVGRKGHVKASFTIMIQAKKRAPEVARVKPDSEIDVLLSKGGWYLVKTSSDLVGWARQEDIDEVFQAEIRAREYRP
ncbi:MAG: hypothetical protein JXR96_06135 [Deltaproteobacteria bacterium]|nr:hypothetical protein [Deltaproteobacteria bacterium]